jgi:predicted nucleotidyltransferase
MIDSLGLSSAQLQLLKTITQQLSEIPGIEAIVLGGSYVRGTARPDSDLDIGIYYSEQSPPEIEAIRSFARKVSIPDHLPIVTGFYEWVRGSTEVRGFRRSPEKWTFYTGTSNRLSVY